MVVLDGANAIVPMLTIGNNQYLQPDYMSPGIPSMLDSKKSPLALLAQTCSQIGADSSNVKPSLVMSSGSADKNKKMDTPQSKSSTAATNTSTTTIPATQKLDKVNDLVFKPYEVNVLSRKNGGDVDTHHHSHHHRPLSKASSVDENLSDESNKSNAKKHDSNHSVNSRVSSRNSNRESPASVNSNNNNNNSNEKNDKNELNESSEKSKSPSLSQKESPRSSLDLLQSQKDLGLYKAGYNPFYPHMDPSNPAFRSSFHHASMLAAAAGYTHQQTTPNPYLSYARIKTPTGGEALVPVCKDPYCTGCQYSAHNQQMLMGVPCPPGCTQCEQQKYGLAMAMSQLPPNHPFAQMSKPFACNWLLADGYCGRRYSTTDELIQHMKSHSPNLSDPATAASVLAAQQSASLLPHSMFFPPGLHRAAAAAGYAPSTSPLSPLSASRYHPYAKPGGLPSSAYGSFNPALSAYYPPYSWMSSSSQRLGAAHP